MNARQDQKRRGPKENYVERKHIVFAQNMRILATLDFSINCYEGGISDRAGTFNVSPDTYSKWISGRNVPNIQHLGEIVTFYRTQLDLPEDVLNIESLITRNLGLEMKNLIVAVGNIQKTALMAAELYSQVEGSSAGQQMLTRTMQFFQAIGDVRSRQPGASTSPGGDDKS